MPLSMRNTITVQRGFSLVEVLVTVLVLAIGLLGLAGLQLTSLRNNTMAYERSQATLLAYSILERMRANRSAANAGAYNVALDTAPSGTSCLGPTATCSPGDMAAYDLSQWKCTLGKWDKASVCAGITGALPQGDGSVALNGNLVTITIQWEEKRGAATPAAKLTTFTVNTVL